MTFVLRFERKSVQKEPTHIDGQPWKIYGRFMILTTTIARTKFRNIAKEDRWIAYHKDWRNWVEAYDPEPVQQAEID